MDDKMSRKWREITVLGLSIKTKADLKPKKQHVICLIKIQTEKKQTQNNRKGRRTGQSKNKALFKKIYYKCHCWTGLLSGEATSKREKHSEHRRNAVPQHKGTFLEQ